ncbi:MAG TPA: hypothetical protein DCP69_11990 [Candidatus Omnitrophica bacterium]|nr:hypothetical protein [Candidatus Omnitrophota bacterium]
MSDALLRNCITPGCSELTASGRCPNCAQQREDYRGTSTSRGYGARWRHFRPIFVRMLIAAEILPVCGARLSGVPSPHSQCASNGRLVARSADGSDLHFDHDPPLRDQERADVSAVCDPDRITILCAACHNRKSQGEQQRTG